MLRLWLVKNKSPSTVPNWFTFRPQSQVPIVHPPGAVARAPRQSQGLRSIIDHGQVTRSDVLRIAFKYMLSAEVVIPVHGDWVEFPAFMGNLGILEGVATDPVLVAMEINRGSHLIMKNINGTVCLRDDNPAELPLVKEDWFHAAEESAPPVWLAAAVPSMNRSLRQMTRPNLLKWTLRVALTPIRNPP